MKTYFLQNCLLLKLREYIFIFLTATIFLSITTSKSFPDENVFIIENVKVEGKIDLNFSRDQYTNKAFLSSFQILMSKVLLEKDMGKLKNIKLNKIRDLVKSFKILEESYKNEKYKAIYKIIYNDSKIKKFLIQENISFSQPKNIKAIFYPVLFVDGEIKSFNDNFFYKKWLNIEIKNNLINFILPIEDLDDISEIVKMKNKIEELNIDTLVNKYNVISYVFALMSYQEKELNVHLKTNFNNNKLSKNISYKIKNINDQEELNIILKNLKMKITDLWKQENIINLAMPLSIRIKFEHSNLKNLDKLKNIFYKINIIENYELEEFNIKNSYFKIYYYGNPKKLSSELIKVGYELKNNQGRWQLFKL